MTILFTTHDHFQKSKSIEVVAIDKVQNLKIAKLATDIFKPTSDYNLESCEQIIDQKIEGKDDLCCDTSLRSESSIEQNKQSTSQSHQQSETTCYLMMENMLSAHEPSAEQCINQAIQGALSQFQQLSHHNIAASNGWMCESVLKDNSKIEEIGEHKRIQDILYQLQELHEAMYFSEMENMLLSCFQLSKLPQEIALVSFGIGLACYEQKKYEDATQHLRESERKLQEYYHLDPDPTHLNDISYCRVYMGEVESAQCHYSAAVEHFLVAMKTHQIQPSVFQQSFQLPELSLCAKTSKLALALHCVNQVVDSERYYRKALLCNDATPSDIISVKSSLGNLLHSVGDHERAVEEYVAAIEKAEIEDDALSQAWTHGNLGNTYLSLGKYERGLYHLQKSLELTIIYEPTPSAISRALNNLGTAYQALSKLDEAESYYDEALSQAIFGNDLIGQARAYGNIGNLYMLQKNQERAIPHYSEVLRLSKDRSTVYVDYHNRGCAFFDLAEKRKREQFINCPRREYQYIAWGPNTSDLECKHYQDELEDNIVQLYKQGLSDFKKVIKNYDQTSCDYNERPPEPEQFDNVFGIDDKDDDISNTSLIFTESKYNVFDNDTVSIESLLNDTHYNRQNNFIVASDCRTICIVGDPYTPPFKFKDEEWILGPLPHARREAQTVGHYMKTTPLIDEEPTKEVVLSRLRQSKLIHLATHGSASHAFIVLDGTRYDFQSTMVSTRFIENENRILLYASDVESIQLQPSLVVLSSCDSGRGVFKGDDVQGMARAFLLSGAQAVLTSLWKVPDQSGCFLMQYFYRYMLDGYTSSEALQKAILSIRGCLMFSQYIHWGGYQLTGKDVKIEIEVTPEDKSIWSNLSRTCSPFPRLDELLSLEKNLLSLDSQYIQVMLFLYHLLLCYSVHFYIVGDQWCWWCRYI